MTRSLAVLAVLLLAQSKHHHPPVKLPSSDLKQRILWGSELEIPDGPSLAFGGQDQVAEDGNPHTRIRVDGEWKPIIDELNARNPLLGVYRQCIAIYLREPRRRLAAYRRGYFEGEKGPSAEELKELAQYRDDWKRYLEYMESLKAEVQGEDLARLNRILDEARKVPALLEGVEAFSGAEVRRAADLLTLCERVAELADAEPSERALSPIAYDPKTKLFVIFGGDHLDYLTNDTWVFDPAKKRWSQRHPPTAPPPRANHLLVATGDGKIALSGGYTYTSSTDYVGAQYGAIGGEDWVYDIEANTWTGKGGVAETRTYRTGKLHPDYYMQGPAPDPKAFADWLAAVPVNTWTLTRPPQLPALNRDWGTAVLDPDRDLILRWSGGHSAHGGTDVLQYHMNTNRWELTAPVEFPLGQLYSNTEYPEGWNFNHRPWITGHTYQSYGYDPNLKQMLFTGKREYCYVYDPGLGDWIYRFTKPKGMVYGDCFYTLTLTPTPQGLVCWTNQGQLFRFESRAGQWRELPLKGEKMPGSVVDNSTIVYDSKRDRLLAFRKGYGDKNAYDGTIAAVDVKSGEVSTVSPGGMEKGGGVPYLCQLRYDSANDLILGGCTMEPGADGLRRTPAYDCAGNRWVSLKIGGDDPSGKRGRNVSLGLMVDAKRKLYWAVDTNSNVYVLRLAVASADLQPM